MILLDTHVALWLVAEPDRIGESSRDALNAATKVLYSSISIAEIRIKQMIGRLVVPDDLDAELRRAGLAELPLTAEHSLAMASFPQLTRHDPFDRLLLSQAMSERCDFLTADARLLTLELPWVRDARS